MDLLKMALEAKVPFISVKSDDMVYAAQVLSFIAGTTVKPLMIAEGSTLKDALKQDVYYTTMDNPAPEQWRLCKAMGKTLVFINTKKSALHLDCGVLLPPKPMVEKFLIDSYELPPSGVSAITQALGGLTLKEIHEIMSMALQTGQALDLGLVNRIRRKVPNRAKGINQVETDQATYSPPVDLGEWLDSNGGFFLKPPHPSIRPRGLLFDGPPGTGKTAGAKFVAQALGLPLYRLDIGGMKGKYVGDSENSLATALQQLDQASPCVALFDEVEKAFNTHGDKGVTNSMLGNLLWWMQEHESQVFVVMTTNDRKAIPAELFREGRIDSTMTFNGVETLDEAYQFVESVYAPLALAVGLDPEYTAAPLNVVLEGLFASGKPVPQVKIVQEVHRLVKAQLLFQGV